MTTNTFLDAVLGDLFAPPKKTRKQDPGYGRLYRWCKKNNITYTRDQTYWDFNHDYETVLEVAQERLATGNPHWPFNQEE